MALRLSSMTERIARSGSSCLAGTDQWAGFVGAPWRSWSLIRLAFHPDLLDLAERFLGSADLRLHQAELWAKYAGAVDYDQRHHRDFVNHSLVVPKRSQPATQMQSWILLSYVGDEDSPTKIVPLSVGREHPVLARPWASRRHELPPRGDVRQGGGLDHRSRRNPVHVSDRRTPPRVGHDRPTINPLSILDRLRRVGTALDRQSRLGHRRHKRTGSRSSSVRLPGSLRHSLRLRATRSGTSRPSADTQTRYRPGRSDALPLRGLRRWTEHASRALRDAHRAVLAWVFRLVMVTFTASDELRGAEFVGADLRDAWFRQSNLAAFGSGRICTVPTSTATSTACG